MKLVAGNVFGFWMFVFVSLMTVYLIHLSKNDKLSISLRRIAGLEAIEEAVGRSTEMGKPTHFTPGLGDIIGANAPETFASLEILSHTAGLAAKYDSELIVTLRQPNVFPLAQESVRQAYTTAGRTENFKEDNIRFLSSNQNAYTSGVVGIMHREQTSANIMAGLFMGEALLLAEAGAQIGAIQVAITASVNQLPFFVAACDYTIIGEELFAAGAYFSNDKVKLGGLAAQDYFKLGVIAIIIVGTVMTSMGNTAIQQLLVK